MNIETVKPEYRELILKAATEVVDLRGANLRGANLSGTNLRGADLSGANLKVYQAGEWISYITPSHIRIGCQFHETKKWREFSDSEIDAMNRNALAYWKENKAIVLSIAESFVEQEKKFS